MDNDIYPTTIITTRYQGAYEGGRWAALDCSFEEVPLAAIGDDIECAEFWNRAHAGAYETGDFRAWVEARAGPPEARGRAPRRILNVGAGDTPEAALAALQARRLAAREGPRTGGDGPP